MPGLNVRSLSEAEHVLAIVRPERFGLEIAQFATRQRRSLEGETLLPDLLSRAKCDLGTVSRRARHR
jgi:hypothetical protein